MYQDVSYPTYAREQKSDMGKPPQVKEIPRSRLIEWLKLLGEAATGIGILVLLWSISQQLAGYKYEVARLYEVQNKILQIFEKREDGGRVALQAQIDRLELELKTMKPAERRKAMEEQLVSLKKRLDVSKLNSKDLAGPRDYGEVK